MKSYKDLTAQIEALQKEAAQARHAELTGAIADIKAKMQEYGITVADLGISSTKKNAKLKTPVAAKYHDPVTGSTWSGRGKPPKWIAGKDRGQYLIK